MPIALPPPPPMGCAHRLAPPPSQNSLDEALECNGDKESGILEDLQYRHLRTVLMKMQNDMFGVIQEKWRETSETKIKKIDASHVQPVVLIHKCVPPIAVAYPGIIKGTGHTDISGRMLRY